MYYTNLLFTGHDILFCHVGINDKLKEKEENIISPRRYLNPSEMQVPQTRLIGFTPKKRPTSAQPNAIPRNPLTGEGYNDSDFIRHGTFKKKGLYDIKNI